MEMHSTLSCYKYEFTIDVWSYYSAHRFSSHKPFNKYKLWTETITYAFASHSKCLNIAVCNPAILLKWIFSLSAIAFSQTGMAYEVSIIHGSYSFPAVHQVSCTLSTASPHEPYLG